MKNKNTPINTGYPSVSLKELEEEVLQEKLAEANQRILISMLMQKYNNEISEALRDYMGDIKILLEGTSGEELDKVRNEARLLMIDRLTCDEALNPYDTHFFLLEDCKAEGLSKVEALDKVYNGLARRGFRFDSQFFLEFRKMKPRINAIWESDNDVR
jgi:hypothetical protein